MHLKVAAQLLVWRRMKYVHFIGFFDPSYILKEKEKVGATWEIFTQLTFLNCFNSDFLEEQLYVFLSRNPDILKEISEKACA